jgi:hypothetical protein
MAVTNFSPLLGLALPTTGDLSGTWGTVVNDAITGLLDSAIAGTTTLSADTDVTLSTTNGAANQARNAIILWTATGTVTRNITAPAQSKAYFVINSTGGTQAIVIRGSGPTTGVTVPAGARALVAWNGSDFVKVVSNPVVLTSDVSGTLPVANGGTGVSSPGASGNLLTSNGTVWTSAAPSAAGGLTYIFTTTSVTAVDKQGVLTDTSGGAFTVTLPATPTTGAQVVVADAGNAWGTNNLTVGRNGSTIAGLAENLTCDINGASVQLVYDGTTWEVYAQVGGNGGTAVTLDGVQTLTNKTLSGANNTLTVDGTNAVGFRTIPQNSQSTAYTTVLADSGKHIFHPAADNNARTFTIPANSSVAYPIGTALTFINMAVADVTIAITSDTLILSPEGTTGSRTLATNGSATCIKIAATQWLIAGSGLT